MIPIRLEGARACAFSRLLVCRNGEWELSNYTEGPRIQIYFVGLVEEIAGRRARYSLDWAERELGIETKVIM
jgi:hypothetical protein